ncbi:MAG: hypothetical protein HY810_03005 [Candidatus Omnitrophica bacterium]|nr:hypothetical protein [Candidatus Omnitrophota bacterium]
MNSNNLFIQRRFQVQQEPGSNEVHLIGALYIAYYFFVQNELYVSKYALCIRMTKNLAELKQTIKH